MGDAKLYTEIKPPNASQASDAALRNHHGVYALPEWLLALTSVLSIVAHDWGYLRSAQENKPLDADGAPLPMYSYGLIEYLIGLDLSAKSVFEFGAGQSTLFWAARARQVHAAENNADWARRIAEGAPRNCRVDLVQPGGMAAFFRAIDTAFDIIAIDCAENRYECAVAARERLAQGGFIILDNSDWYPNSARLLRESGLLEVDFHGLRPTHHYACTTSVFFERAFAPAPKGARLPLPPRGGKQIVSRDWDRPSANNR